METENWQDKSNCKGMDVNLFFPAHGRNTSAEAREACSTCPVRVQCLDHAIVCNEQDGIWGGVNMRTQGPSLRKEYRERVKQIRFVKCGHPKTADNTNDHGQCITCRVIAVKRYNEKQVMNRANTP